MNIFKKIYCRLFQASFRLIIPLLPYRKPQILNELDSLANLLSSSNKRFALIVTDDFLAKTQHFEKLKKSLEKSAIKFVVFDRTHANPTVKNVEEARTLFINNKCDCIIAYGGGSPIDCAKAVGARIAYPNKSLYMLKGLLKVRREIPLLVAIPTTAGTGSEVTVTAVITDAEKKHKYTMNSFALIPSVAVLDARATLTLPKGLTATTGMDALTHAVEAYIGKSTTRETREASIKAVKLVFENLQLAYEDGQNLCARENMLECAYLAGVAFTKSYVGYVHAVAHTLGGQYNVAHGLANSILLPNVLRAYGSSVYKRLYSLACAVGIADESDSYESGALKFIEAIEALNEKFGIPKKLDCIKREDVSKMAELAEKEANPLYPVPMLMDKKQLEKFYYQIADWS